MLTLILTLKLLVAITTAQPKFETQVIDNNISIGYGIALGDVDGDGKPDILLADKKQFVWYRNGDWKKFVMIENLTESDNVCIAARDLNNDGKVEVAVGAQWNPGETSNEKQSGSVHYLVRPADPTQKWKAVELHHEPTIHRMRWAKSSEGNYYLVVVPLHGRGNKGGEGEPVKIFAYEFPENVEGEWTLYPLDNSMHMTHNFDLVESTDINKSGLFVAGKEGIRFIHEAGNAETFPGMDKGAGEVRVGNLDAGKKFIAGIEPMHGHELTLYLNDSKPARIVLDSLFNEGHALATADLLGTGSDQIIAGWRLPNKDGKVGIKLFNKKNQSGTEWESFWIDDNGMACEDLQVMDLNKDGKQDIIASGRATHNLKIYWNKSIK